MTDHYISSGHCLWYYSLGRCPPEWIHSPTGLYRNRIEALGGNNNYSSMYREHSSGLLLRSGYQSLHYPYLIPTGNYTSLCRPKVTDPSVLSLHCHYISTDRPESDCPPTAGVW